MIKSVLSWVATLFLAGAGWLVSAPATATDPAQKQPVTAKAKPNPFYEEGRKIYNFRCYFCHGYSGNAKTLAASFVDPKPRDFTSVSPSQLTRSKMLTALRDGRPGTAMNSFTSVLTPNEMEAVVDFIRVEFMQNKAENTRYHTVENGWSDHQKYSAAFPFATGTIALDTPWEKLSPDQQSGKRLFLSSCISCHDRAKVNDEGKIWDKRPLSFPRNQYSPSQPKIDAMASASPYAIHDRPPHITNLTLLERRGEKLFQANCAFCHGADGTGSNWIGSFLQPHPRNLVSSPVMDTMTRSRLRDVIRDGLIGTSMPAWKHVLKENEVQAVIAYISRAFHPIKDS